MKNYNIVFQLNDSEKLIIELEEPLANVDYCYLEMMYFLHDQSKILLWKDSIRYNLECLRNILNQALHNQLKLHESITQDIGYLYNECLQNKSYLTCTKEDNVWVGYKYQFTGGNGFMIWIYNEKNGDIIFEITPYFVEQSYEKIDNFLDYNKWIKGYRPILIRIVPRETAQHWLDQADKILATIKNNVLRMRAEGQF